MELAAHICKSASIRRIRSGYRSSTSLGGTSSLSALQPRPHPGELLLVPLPPLPLSPLFFRIDLSASKVMTELGVARSIVAQ